MLLQMCVNVSQVTTERPAKALSAVRPACTEAPVWVETPARVPMASSGPDVKPWCATVTVKTEGSARRRMNASVWRGGRDRRARQHCVTPCVSTAGPAFARIHAPASTAFTGLGVKTLCARHPAKTAPTVSATTSARVWMDIQAHAVKKVCVSQRV